MKKIILQKYWKNFKKLIIKEKEENVKRLEQNLNDKLNEIKKEKKKNIHLYKKKYESSLDEAREEIKDILKQMREEKSEKIARRSFHRLAGIEHAMRSDFAKDEDEIAEKYTPIDWDNIKIGDKLQIHCYKHNGKLHQVCDEAIVLDVDEDKIKNTINKKGGTFNYEKSK